MVRGCSTFPSLCRKTHNFHIESPLVIEHGNGTWTIIYGGFSIAMFDYQRVSLFGGFPSSAFYVKISLTCRTFPDLGSHGP